MKSLLGAAVALSFLVITVGCNSGPTVVAVKGVATRGGRPIQRLSLTFYPDDNGRPSTGMTDEDGRFELSFARNEKGAIVGTHKVVATFRPRNPTEETDFASGKLNLHPDQDALLEKYGNRETTPMIVEITNPTKDLDLKFD